jgi:hypothetical protein
LDHRDHNGGGSSKAPKLQERKWWKLKREAQPTFRKRMITAGSWEGGGEDSMWVKMETCIQKIARGDKGVRSVKLRTHGGGMRMSKGLSRRRSDG